jgi:hypothetical protein
MQGFHMGGSGFDPLALAGWRRALALVSHRSFVSSNLVQWSMGTAGSTAGGWRGAQECPKASIDPFEVRTGAIHRSGAWVVLNGAVVLRPPRGILKQDLVRRACSQVISKTLSYAQVRCARLVLTRVLPLGFARVIVVERDYRKRRLASFGLGPDLVCTVQLKRIARIRSPDILDSTIEQVGPFRIRVEQGMARSATKCVTGT